MTIQLTKTEISKLARRKKIVSCVAVVCRVCGFRQHVSPSISLPEHERCPNGCTLFVTLGQCRLCGDPIRSRRPMAACRTHRSRNYHSFTTGLYTTRIAETHWHAADGTGPVSQYAIP